MAQPYSTNQVNEGFVPASSLETSIKNYIQATGDSELSDIYYSLNDKRKLKELQIEVLKCLVRDFGYTEAEIIRYTRVGMYSQRLMGIKKVSLKKQIVKSVGKSTQHFTEDDFPPNATLFKSKKEEEIVQEALPNWFEADPIIRSVQGYNRGRRKG